MTAYRALSCPFCGHRSFVISEAVGGAPDDGRLYRVTCADCGQDRPDTEVTAR